MKAAERRGGRSSMSITLSPGPFKPAVAGFFEVLLASGCLDSVEIWIPSLLKTCS